LTESNTIEGAIYNLLSIEDLTGDNMFDAGKFGK
jgi:hypothetical protein